MKLLVDTHLLVWAAGNSAKLSKAARKLLNSTENELYFSVVSVWEIAIKRARSRPGFQVNPRLLRTGLLENGYEELLIRSEHVVAIDGLPPVHRDPFDRLLVAQAIVEGITLLTSDPLVAKYAGPVHRV